MKLTNLFPVLLGITLNVSLLDIKLGGYALGLLFIYSVIVIIQKRKVDFNHFYDCFPFVLYVIIYLFFFILSEDYSQSIKQLEKQIMVLVLPILIFIFVYNVKQFKTLINVYLIGLILISIVSCLMLEHFYYSNMKFISTMDSNYLQWKYPHLMEIHPSYWSYYLVVGNILLLSNLSNLKYKINIIFQIVFNLNLFYLAGRSSLVINILIYLFFISYFCFKSLKLSKIKILIISLILTMVMALTFYQSPYLKSKLYNLKNNSDERFFLWKSAYEIIEDNYFVFGEGITNGEKSLKIYLDTNYEKDPRLKYNKFDIHNQYLKEYLDFGLIGLISILLIILYPLRLIKKLNYVNLALICFSLLVFLSQFVESVFSRFQGKILITTIFSILILAVRANNLKNKDK
ncbi:hypothetical protein SB49_11935 [Sediminicola sp. YIK13]|uniref:O-antigen ligase family protein n=1 Tax=Sediminicola sp. YIK13 TaxID=1453352 RepID=UPI000720896B|nr:O-antigen ligase family protein [Sediminicola sp. YIK13]ALM08444.1 hypothetical protein SB49_11935 [Sediminicola sp. YIK13]